jgi:hypothetical protein
MEVWFVKRKKDFQKAFIGALLVKITFTTWKYTGNNRTSATEQLCYGHNADFIFEMLYTSLHASTVRAALP